LAIKTYQILFPAADSTIESGSHELEVFVNLHHPCMIEFQGFSPGNDREGFKIATVYASG
jgi:hypothetical protein